jgi:hypothetical protein
VPLVALSFGVDGKTVTTAGRWNILANGQAEKLAPFPRIAFRVVPKS